MDGNQRDALAYRQGSHAVWQPSALVALALVTLSGLALRLHGLGATSLWSDEIFSAFWIQREHAFLWTEGLFIETTPPLYYSALQLWARYCGDSDAALRLLSVAFSTATIPVVYALGSRLDRPVTGVIAAAVFALMPMQIYYAQEVRVYALLPLLVAVAMLALCRFTAAVQDGNAGRQWRWLVVFALALVALIYSHATSVFTVAVLDLSIAALLLSWRNTRPALLRLLAINLPVAILALPQLAAILMQHARDDLEWISAPDLVSTINLASIVLVDPVTPIFAFRAAAILAVVTAATFLAILLQSRLDARGIALLVAPPALFFMLAFAISFYAPFLIPKIIIWFGVPFAVLVAIAWQGRAPQWLRLAFLASLLLSFCVGYHGVFVRTLADKEDWRGAITDVASRLAPSDLLCVGPHTSVMPVLRYAPGRIACRWTYSGRDDSVALQPDSALPITRMTSAALSEAAHAGRCVWLVSRAGDWQRHQALAEESLVAPLILDRQYARLAVVAMGPGCQK